MNEPSGGALIPIRDTSWSDRGRYMLRRGTTMIGRSTMAHVCINSSTISRNHAKLDWTDEGLVLTHLSTTSLTLVNGVTIADTVVLKNGDLIELGRSVCMRIDLFGASDDDATTPVQAPRRQIQAILYADVVGYTKLTASDEGDAITRLQSALTMIQTLSRNNGGVIANVAGDGLVALFPSVMAALNAAVDIQNQRRSVNEGLDHPLEFRVGLNSGDVVTALTEHGMSTMGDSINVTARVQEIAPPGGIFLTGAVFDQLHGALTDQYEIVPRKDATIIDRQIRIFEVVLKK